MIRFKEFLIEQSTGTYISVGFDDETNDNLKEFAESLDLDPVENFHCTICYSKDKLDIKNGTYDLTGSAKITGIEYLGEIGSDYRAIVLNIESDEIEKLHSYYKENYNYKHTYPDFIQHISLGYKPKEGMDLSNIELPDFKINISKQNIKPLKN